MNEPPDLADPGVFVPPANNYVTIASTLSNESGMETDGSNAHRGRKRNRLNKICGICNKKKRKHSQAVDGKTGCCCASADSENSDSTTVVKVNNITPNNITSPQNVTPTIARNKYEVSDVGPFIVHVQKETKSPSDNTTLHPVTFGKFLKNNAIHDIVDGSLKRIGRNKICLAFKNFNNANAFIFNTELQKNNLKAFLPTFHITRMGLVRGVPSDWSPEDIIENARVPDNCGKILKVRRINYKTFVEGSPVWKPTQNVVITSVRPKLVFRPKPKPKPNVRPWLQFRPKPKPKPKLTWSSIKFLKILKFGVFIMFPSDAHALTKFYCITTELSERHTTIPEQSRWLTTQLCRGKRS
ncbi:hypothetical protein PYW08_011284 [Mythimna loreyi]|uniref:Uncharacterized protein n=1 Tax=Mythimna loreyi TaxID=667449 RepID=A0ACC2Q368_9NEOP|nr:hypothetical protein PYW08_011284 [Mythimna loreyi]